MVSELYLDVIINVAIAFLIISPMIRKKNYRGAVAAVVAFFGLALSYYYWAFDFSLAESFWKAIRQTALTAAAAMAHSWGVNFDARRKEKSNS